ncbi:MAG: putative porin, partial [Bacteroidota bacterium]
LTTSLKASYELPSLNINLGGQYTLINEYIYFNENAIPTQLSSPINLIQFTLDQQINLGKFHLINIVAFQESSEDVIRVPQLSFKHSLYYQNKWFRYLNIMIGADLRMLSSFTPYTYNPLVGQFILQNEEELDWYPSVDFYLAFRVTKFQAYFKWENFTQQIRTDELYFQTANYPFSTGSGFRFGLRWRMLD